MGANVIMDILGSIIIGGMLMTLLWRMNDDATNHMYNYGGELILQQNLAVTCQIIEYDFRKIGYCETWNKMVDPTNAIVIADSDAIKFLADIYPDGDPDGNIDSVYYKLGPVSECSQTPNPRDRYLYRIINGEDAVKISMGITNFHLLYFDALGDTIEFPISYPVDTKTINSMEINLMAENVAVYDTGYSSAVWRQIRLVSRNLKER